MTLHKTFLRSLYRKTYQWHSTVNFINLNNSEWEFEACFWNVNNIKRFALGGPHQTPEPFRIHWNLIHSQKIMKEKHIFFDSIFSLPIIYMRIELFSYPLYKFVCFNCCARESWCLWSVSARDWEIELMKLMSVIKMTMKFLQF